MALNAKHCTEAVNAACDAIAALADSGILRIYDGAQPATADTAIGGVTVLAELTMNATAFGAAAEGVATAAAIVKDSVANATGTAAWFRLWQANGTDEILDGSVGTSGCDLNLNSVAIQENAEVEISSFTITVPKAAA